MANDAVTAVTDALKKVIGFKRGGAESYNGKTYVGVDDPSTGRFTYVVSQAQFDAAPKGRGNLIMNYADGVLYICDGKRAVDIKTATGGAVAASVYANDPAFTEKYAPKGEYASQEAFNDLQSVVQNLEIPSVAGLLSKVEADQLYASFGAIEAALKDTVVVDNPDGTQTETKVDKFASAADLKALRREVAGKADTAGEGKRYVTDNELESYVTNQDLENAVANVSVDKEAVEKIISDGIADGSLKVEGKPGKDGENGKSAYEVAVANGFEGDETAWLESLKGEAVVGAAGPQGEQGAAGKSAFEIAKELNPELADEAAFIASLKGTAGIQGEAGAVGKSAFEIANENQPEDAKFATEADWLASLKGERGEAGAAGEVGATGKSAFEIAKELNPELENEAAFVASLKGEKGEAGKDAVVDTAAVEAAMEASNKYVLRTDYEALLARVVVLEKNATPAPTPATEPASETEEHAEEQEYTGNVFGIAFSKWNDDTESEDYINACLLSEGDSYDVDVEKVKAEAAKIDGELEGYIVIGTEPTTYTSNNGGKTAETHVGVLDNTVLNVPQKYKNRQFYCLRGTTGLDKLFAETISVQPQE